MEILTAKDPQWANEEHTSVNLTIETDEMGELPFHATPDDPEKHGQKIYEKAVAGEFGEIAECK